MDDLARLESLPARETADWLVEPTARKAGVYRGALAGELALDNGLLRRTFLLGENLGCVALEQLSTGQSLLRAVRPEARVTLDGVVYEIGGLVGQAIGNFLSPRSYSQLKRDPRSFAFVSWDVSPITPRFAWKPRLAWMSREAVWPPPGVHVTFRFRAPAEAPGKVAGVTAQVHYELYDGLPLLCKWLTLEQAGGEAVTVDSFTSELLACVEASSQVEDLADPLYPNLHVESDFTSVAMQGASSQRDVVHWLTDPDYPTQVNYLRQTRCLLEVRPPLGPHVLLEPGRSFESFRTWLLAFEDRDEVRQGLSLCRMYRTIAPWVQENPLIHHVRDAAPASVRLAVDQCADVGFELVIMTFGSGFDIENGSAGYLERLRELADYAHSKGIALGGYSLLASRSIGPADDVVNPETGKTGGFARFGNSPCLGSRWGEEHFKKLHAFFEATGCDVLEHDGSYPGDVCASTEHPGHVGLEDSRWRQWSTITSYYRWCRARGIYLNVPDWYFLSGSSKTGMGYRETNWSLPRDYQELIERQNIYDGTRYKTPSMGWMFVPLTEYHGGGAAATIEPLREHLPHYERRLQNLLGAGVQACFRGPRLFDGDETRAVVARWVSFYKRYRSILDSDLVPLRRADGRDWDGWLHVGPGLGIPGLAMLYNPLEDSIERTIEVPLYYTGLRGRAAVRVGDGPIEVLELDARGRAVVKARIPAQGAVWVAFTRPE